MLKLNPFFNKRDDQKIIFKKIFFTLYNKKLSQIITQFGSKNLNFVLFRNCRDKKLIEKTGIEKYI